MFENAALAAAIINEIKRNQEIADRRAFNGPDAVPTTEQVRRESRLPRILRRGARVA